jgi:hypothetical protein
VMTAKNRNGALLTIPVGAPASGQGDLSLGTKGRLAYGFAQR